MNTITEKSEILYFFDSTYCIPNGDPFTGEQRYDEETKRILVSDVRIKRYIRDHLLDLNSRDGRSDIEIYVWNDRSQISSIQAQKIASDKEQLSTTKKKDGTTGSAARMKSLKNKYSDITNATELLKKCVDVRLFGGISTEEKDTANLTGPIQFALLNPSLNEVDLKTHQNTSVFVSSIDNTQGAIGTTSVVPYAVNQIHGWINPFLAKHTDLTRDDINLMYKALWESINNKNTRSKANQNSLLLLEIVYEDPTKKSYNIGDLISLNYSEDKKGETIRTINDFKFNFQKLGKLPFGSIIKEVQYYTELPSIETELVSVFNSDDLSSKLKNMKGTIYP